MGVSCQLFSRRWIAGLMVLVPVMASCATTHGGKQICSAGQPAGGTTACVWSFDFGTGNPHRGYAEIRPTTAYSQQTGYGFMNPTVLDASRQGICSDGKPFLFSVDVPEGNYNVTLGLGGASESTT